MTKDEAMQQAIDFLDGSYDAHAVRKALQEALEQPAQEPVGIEPDEYTIDYWESTPAFDRSLRGVKITHHQTGIVVTEDSDRNQHKNKAIAMDRLKELIANHPAPEQNEFARTKSWQGLSDDEIEVIDADCWVYPSDGSELFNHYKFARAIEQALKEKIT